MTKFALNRLPLGPVAVPPSTSPLLFPSLRVVYSLAATSFGCSRLAYSMSLYASAETEMLGVIPITNLATLLAQPKGRPQFSIG